MLEALPTPRITVVNCRFISNRSGRGRGRKIFGTGSLDRFLGMGAWLPLEYFKHESEPWFRCGKGLTGTFHRFNSKYLSFSIRLMTVFPVALFWRYLFSVSVSTVHLFKYRTVATLNTRQLRFFLATVDPSAI